MKATSQLHLKELVQEYRKGRSASSLARDNGVSVWSIITRLRQAGVVMRTPKEQNARWLENGTGAHSFREVVDGLMLGDGQIDPKSILHLEQCNARRGWVLQVQSHLVQAGCTSKLLKIPPRIRVIEGREVISKPATHLYTPAYEELHDERARWYPRGKKIVPRDLALTPLVLLHWFCGDGTCSSDGHLIFCTQGFTRKDVAYLVEKLTTDLGVRASIGKTQRKGQFTTQVARRDEAMKIKTLLDPVIPKCCRYKLRFVRPKRPWANSR
jgi:hypothetical protein